MFGGFKPLKTVGKNARVIIPKIEPEKYQRLYIRKSGEIMSYSNLVQEIEARAAELNKKIPAWARVHPDARAGLELQELAFSLLREMAEEIDRARSHCENCPAHDEYSLEKVGGDHGGS